MNFTFKKRDSLQAPAEAERRRIGVIVHDERGNALVNWRDAPVGTERPVLEILGEPSLSVKTEEISFDPYARSRAPRATVRPVRSDNRTNLRALSEHIKLMRALEERRRNGGDED